MHARSIFLIPSDDLGWGSVRTLLDAQPAATIVGETMVVYEARKAIATTHPDIVLAAETIEGKPVREVLQELRHTSCPTTRFAVFAAALDPEDTLPFAEIGLAGHLLWSDLSNATLPACLATIVESEMIVGSPAVVQAFIEAYQTTREQAASCYPSQREGAGAQPFDALTNRQREILRCVEEGLSDDEIARRIDRSPGTVRKHLQNAYRSLGVESRYAAVRASREQRHF